MLFFLIKQVFESGDIEAISNKLFSMQKSLTMLANVVDYEDKKLQLEGLKNRLEAMASPRLVQAFTAANLGKTCRIEINPFTSFTSQKSVLYYV